MGPKRKPFLNPHTLRILADDIEGLRCKLMLSTEDEEGRPAQIPPIAEQHLLLAFSFIESARAHLKLCAANIEEDR